VGPEERIDTKALARVRPVALACAAIALCLVSAAPAAAAPGDVLVLENHVPFPPTAGGGAVLRVDPVDGMRALVADDSTPPGEPFASPAGIALEADGQVVVAEADPLGRGGRVIRIDPMSGLRTIVSDNASPAGGPSFSTPRGIAVEADGNILVSDLDAFPGGGVIRVDPATGTRTVLSSNEAPAEGPGFLAPAGLAVEPDGDILVMDLYALGGGGLLGGAVIRVDPVTGVRSVVSANTSPAGAPTFVEHTEIALEHDGQILVTSPTVDNLLRVDPSTGARVLLSGEGAPAGGPSIGDAAGVAVEADGTILVATTTGIAGGPGVIRVDPVTGARTTLSANGEPPGEPGFARPVALVVEPAANAPPNCSAVAATPAVIHAIGRDPFRTVRLGEAVDPDGDPLSFHIDGVTQDERVFDRWFRRLGGPDAKLTAAGADSRKVLLRAERDAKGDGRVYRIAFTVSDGTESCAGVAKVGVPRHWWRRAIDSAPPSFDSFTGAWLP
jgi:hypothetical protein